MKGKDLIADLTAIHLENNIDDSDVVFSKDFEETEIEDVYYDEEENKIVFSYISPDTGFVVTDKGLFALACEKENVFKEWMGNKFETVWNLFKFQMSENGYYAEEGKDCKPMNGDPVDFLKKSFKQAKVKVSDDAVLNIWNEFVQSLNNAGYCKVVEINIKNNFFENECNC